MSNLEALPKFSIPQNKLQRRSWAGWTGVDIAFGVTSLLAAIALFVYINDFLAMMAILFVLVPLNIRTEYGRLYWELATGLYGFFYIHLALRDVLWIDEDDSGWLRRILREKRYRKNREKRQVIPVKLEMVQALGESFGVLHQTDRNLDHIFIVADGGRMSSLDVMQQHNIVNELAAATNQVAAQSRIKIGVSYLRYGRPDDFNDLNDYLAESVNPVVASPEMFDLDDDQRSVVDWQRQTLSQLVATAQNFGAAKNRMVVVMSIKPTKEWDKARRGTISDQQVYELPLVQLGRAMVEALENLHLMRLKNVHCLSLTELSEVIRVAWDLDAGDAYNERRLSGELPRTDADIVTVTVDDIMDKRLAYGPDQINQVLTPLYAWPEKIVEVGDDYIRLDDTWISVLRMIKLPREIRVDQFNTLHHLPKPGRWTSMAMVGEAISGNMETTQLVIQQSAIINWMSAFQRNRVVKDPRMMRRQRNLATQAEQVSSDSLGQRFNFLYSCSASSLEELYSVRRELKASLMARGFPCRVVKGRSRQLDAAISAALGVNRL
ncbi:MAG TPA: hypothetical protein VFG56_02930 [Candidatus Saccharimonadales bacterium]|nr:hypothetical protein [Candidatus Saccharimonadales bacterium]